MAEVVEEGTTSAEEFLVSAIQVMDGRIRLITKVAEEARSKGRGDLAASLDRDIAMLRSRVRSIQQALK